MASADTEMRVKIGVDITPFEWQVIQVRSIDDLEYTLNLNSQAGWDIFELKLGTNPIIVVVRREIPQEDS